VRRFVDHFPCLGGDGVVAMLCVEEGGGGVVRRRGRMGQLTFVRLVLGVR
jgi:hypothetical protein